MSEIKTSRPFQERFLDGYDRSQLRQEVQKVQGRLPSSLRKKYATWALGASLALGGVGIPMKVGNLLQNVDDSKASRLQGVAEQPRDTDDRSAGTVIARDLKIAGQIAAQVAGGVTGAVHDVAKTVASPALEKAVQAPQMMASASETVRERFFQREVPFGSIIYNEARRNDISPELVAAVVHTESKFVPTARSHAGAIGLMQLVPKTGRWMGAKDLTNPVQNITAGAKYLRYLTDRFDGDQQKVIAAYNAGEGNVRRFHGIPPFQETRNYVQRVNTFRNDLGSRVEGQMASLATP
ncbi:MAG: lytic transglycosylase domain-containing protein [Thermoanaerobaculia bacterium]